MYLISARMYRAIMMAVSACAGGGLGRARQGTDVLESRMLLNGMAFDAVREFGTGRFPSATAVDDLNGDGKSDLAVANSYDYTVSILLGNGDGSFQPKIDYAVGTYPTAIAIGDFNGDGRPDVVVANNMGNTVSILLGNGDGSLQAKTDYAVGSAPSSLAVGDFNGDSKNDLAVANAGTYPSYGNTVSILLGNGDGSFQAASDCVVGSEPRSVVVGDFNKDGKRDLAVADRRSDAVSILLGNGNGTFQATTDYSVGNLPNSVTVGDFNGDDKSDLAVTSAYDNTLSILLGNGDGSFEPKVSYLVGTVAVGAVVGDFNGDSKSDLAVANSSGSLGYRAVILLGNGDGTFQAHIDFMAGNPVSIAGGDFNGDGSSDLVVTNGSDSTVGIMLSKGDGSFPAVTGYDAGSYIAAMAGGDFNEDGKRDVAVASNIEYPYGGVSLLLGNGDGSFLAPRDLAVAPLTKCILAADLNGDGKLDLAIASGAINATVSILLGNGDGTFKPKTDYVVNGYAYSIVVGDFNGDGKSDLVVANGAGAILLGHGDGTFGATISAPGGKAIAVGDFNGDGKSDLATDDGFTVTDFQSNGDGTFVAEGSFIHDWNDNPVIVNADFNNDGKADLALANGPTDSAFYTVSICLGNGDGTFQPRTTYGAGYRPNYLTVGDINGDGAKDLVAGNYDGNSVSVFLGYGDGSLQPKRDYVVGRYVVGVASGDFAGDGQTDLAVLYAGANSLVGVLVNKATAGAVPTGIALTASTVAENLPAGTVVGRLNTTDADAGASFTYALVPGTGSGGNGLFTIAGNQLKASVSFDYETKAYYNVRVRTTDTGGAWYEQSLTINVVDVAEALVINGSAGNDVITLTTSGPTLVVTTNGVAKNYTLAMQSSITVNGLGGADTVTISGGVPGVSIFGGDGNDSIYGGAGDDYIDCGDGNDLVGAGPGRDTLIGAGGDDQLHGGKDNDSVDGGIGNDSLWGDMADDYIHGGDGNDVVSRGNGNDSIWGDAGDDDLRAGQGNDVVYGGTGRDTLWGDAGDDQLHGEGGNDVIYGNAGNDTIWADGGVNYVDGGDDNDVIYARNALADTVIGGAGSDQAQIDSLLDVRPLGDVETLLA